MNKSYFLLATDLIASTMTVTVQKVMVYRPLLYIVAAPCNYNVGSLTPYIVVGWPQCDLLLP